MRIALISDCFAPRLGGIETQVQGLATVLAERGHEVLVVTETPEGSLGRSRGVVGGVRTWRLASPFLGNVPINPLSGPALEDAMRGADVVHIHTGVVSPFAWHAGMIAARRGIPAVMTWHCVLDPGAGILRASGFPAWLARHGVQHNAVSAMAARLVQRAVGEAGEVRVVHNGVDLSAWRAVAEARLNGGPETRAKHGEGKQASENRPDDGRNSRSHAARPIQVVSARRLAPRKRNRALIETVARARALSGVDAHLTIFGDGPLRSSLLRLAERRGWGWLDLPGRRTPAQLRTACRTADIYLSVSRKEAFGIATLEARAAGLPVVSPAGTGSDDFIVDGVDGLLGGSDDDVARRLAQLLEDDALRERITAHNAAVAPEEGWPVIAAQTEAEYARAIAAQHR